MNMEVTVIIPCGGHHATLLRDAVASCLNAKPAPDRIIIIDDDAAPPVNIIGAPENVQVYRLPYHRGRSAARNFAIQMAVTPWIYFLDADDFLEPTAISDFRAIVNDAPINLVYADYDWIDTTGQRHRVAKQEFNQRLVGSNNPCNIGFFVQRERTLAINGFDDDMSIGEYWDFFLRYVSNPKVKIHKHNRPFFAARQLSSVLPEAPALLQMASLKISAMIRGGYYQAWKTR